MSQGLPSPGKKAAALLKCAGQESPPVSLEAITDLWPNLTINEEDLDGAGYLLDLGARGAEIIVNSKAPEVRRRYTIAHEVAHWVLKNDAGIELTAQREKAIERWCERFAASLLMPGHWVQGDLHKQSAATLLTYVQSAPHEYSVSKQAFRIRVSELSPLSIVEISDKQGKREVAERFVSRATGWTPIREELGEAMASLTVGSDSWCTSPRGELSWVYRLVWRSGDERKWLMCFAPRSCSTKRGSGPAR